MTHKIKHVQQECPQSCAIACIAMLAHTSFIAVREKVSRPNISQDTLDRMLVYFGMLPIRNTNTLTPGELYTAAVPSLNRVGTLHQIIIDTRGDAMQIHDPNEGREGVEVYTSKNLRTWAGLTRIVYCRSLEIESEMVARAKNYHKQQAKLQR